MASKHLSIAEELLNAVTEPHTKVLCLLHDSRIISVDNFKRQRAELMKHHWIDSSILQTSDKQHPTKTGIFDVFGKKTGQNASKLKKLLIDWMCDKHTELSNCMAIALNQSKQSFTEWLQHITMNEDYVPDELTIYCLSRFLNLHTLVYTTNFCWSTLMNQFKYDDEELYDKSDIRLIYCGHSMFAELKHICQPKPQPVLATPVTPLDVEKSKKRTSAGKRSKKVTYRGDKPCTRQNRKPVTSPSLPPPPTPRPSRRSRRNIDYLQLNNGLEEPTVTSPKSKKMKPYHPQEPDHWPVGKLHTNVNVINLTSNNSWRILRKEINCLIL